TAIFAGNGNTVYRSDDNGTSWESASSALGCQTIESLVSYRTGSAEPWVIAGTDSGIFRSVDNGVTWSHVVTEPPLSDVYQLLVDSAGTITRLLAATSIGLSRSTDDGMTWTRVGVTDGKWSMASDGIRLFAGLGFFGRNKVGVPRYCSTVFRSTDDGDTWIESDSGLAEAGADLTSLASLVGISGDTILLAGSSPGGVFASTDAGESWNPANTGLRNQYVKAIQMEGATVLAATAGGIFRSENETAYWIRSDSGTADSIFTAFGSDGVNLFAGSGSLSPEVTGRLFELKYVNDVFLSTDNGITWTMLESQIADSSFITSLVSVNGNLTVGTGDYHLNSDLSTSIKGGVYLLRYSGGTWSVSDSSLVGNYVYSLAVECKTVFAGADPGGVFRSSDGGATWEAVNSGLSDTNVTALLVAQPYLYAATPSGVWRRPLSELTGIESSGGTSPLTFKLSQNYPNPFNPSTAISYQLSAVSDVRLTVYDVLGRIVATPVDGRQSAGTHTVVFDGSKYASGVYFYRLVALGADVVRKMVLLK
ncbi:MAG TPA: T9SS type A sorting domain-containing protein, partial [Candidatus Kryptobacter bacterium]|nr:T9SS type A sorting domain-containing protein [Candidatus Kryptobacter bacterium]